METNRNRHRRRSIRLQGFDYSQPGAYFITVCTRERACLFGDVVDGEMRLNEAGRIVEQCWSAISIHFPNVVLDAFVVMPNHVHGIVLIAGETVGAKNFSPLPGTSKTIGSIVRGFKIGVTKWFRGNCGTGEVWQRNYYEHIIRDDESLIRSYDWRTAALAASGMLFLVALPLAWFGARDPAGSKPDRRSRVAWSACLPYLRDRSMIVLFAVRFSCGVAFFQIAHLVALTMSKGFDAATGAKAVSVFGAGAVVSALLFGWLSDRYGRSRILGLSYLTRGVGTLLLAFDFSNEFVYFAVVALAIGPTFGTVAVGNVLFYERVGPRMAGMVLGMSFIVHQIGSAAGPMMASITYDRTGSYDGFMVVMGLILLASGLALVGGKETGERAPASVAAASPSPS